MAQATGLRLDVTGGRQRFIDDVRYHCEEALGPDHVGKHVQTLRRLADAGRELALDPSEPMAYLVRGRVLTLPRDFAFPLPARTVLAILGRT